MRLSFWPGLALLVVSCTGAISGSPKGQPTGGGAGTSGSPTAGTGSGSAGSGAAGAAGAAGAETACVTTPPPAQRLFLLDMQRYVNTLSDLLGHDAVTDLDRTNLQRTDLISQGVPTLSDATVYERLAEYASKTLTGAKLDTFVGCTGAAQTDACARKALAAFMERAYRRPPDAAEVDGLMATPFAAGRVTSFARGVQLAVEALLQAGSTLYLKEIGAPVATAPASGPVALDPYEVASQLSYFLLDSVPDAELYQAAKSGALAQPAEVEKQVTRLLTQPAAQQKLTDVVTSQYHLDDVLTATAVDGTLQDIYTESLRLSFFQETQQLVDDVLWRNPRSFLDLFQTNKTFVNQELATKVYGIPFQGAAGTFVPVTLPATRPAAGLLTQGSLLAGKAKANTGSVVKRGKSIRVNFLCLQSPPPPPTSDPAIKAKLDAQVVSSKSEAELAADRAADMVCKACHSFFDPLGLALNQFDRVGRFVPAEPAMTSALDGVDPRWKGLTVEGAVDLGQKMSGNPALAACVTSSVLRYATREPNNTVDCGVQQVSQQFASSGFEFKTLVKATSTSDLFLMRSRGAP
jgi:Protein of unknown function (DUF1592)/Protein of unknown function (DUF1588)/Protein of unknown function (DUF1595)/Protein of unknown function (DUF1585)